ncbi:hypothetical protein [Streptomyces griseorubiginosus]|uniref:hypothetical protein n=1 Tax=Streptomyces griseorubiginosus TaxID=67304 RepID=UPI001AD69DCB|nr:hypothetical protein [Streptomyces griseorubiginosus]MBO4257289.1 hypothetical protein [Streptomyces griseorubiginosus]
MPSRRSTTRTPARSSASMSRRGRALGRPTVTVPSLTDLVPNRSLSQNADAEGDDVADRRAGQRGRSAVRAWSTIM